jgi:myo-inositol-1(or 4)-monophosphatase
MTEVARGAFAGFVNVTTNLWDVAAGEVLIKACGGKVTDLEGKPIDYARFGEVSLLAAKREMHPRLLQLVQGGVE